MRFIQMGRFQIRGVAFPLLLTLDMVIELILYAKF